MLRRLGLFLGGLGSADDTDERSLTRSVLRARLFRRSFLAPRQQREARSCKHSPGKKGLLPKALCRAEGCRGSDRAAVRPEEVLQQVPGPRHGCSLQARCTSQLWSPRWSWQIGSRSQRAAGVGGTLSVSTGACNRTCFAGLVDHISHLHGASSFPPHT